MRGRGTIFLSILLPALLAAEQVDNPLYRQWSALKVGTVVEYSTVTTRHGTVASDVETRLKLVEARADRVVLESGGSMEAGDSRVDLPVTREVIPARIRPPSTRPARRERVVAEGDQTLTVAGRTWKCHWKEVEGPSVRTRTWTSERIPGGIVRQEERIEGADPAVTTVELLEFTVPE